MSDWNQNQRSWYPSTWTEDIRNSFNGTPANYYANEQYVGFNEFLNQIQQNSQYPVTTHSNPQQLQQQYPIYNSIVDHSIPAASVAEQICNQLQPISVSNNSTNQCNITDSNFTHFNNSYLTSNLTPTATEFVPKNSHPQLNVTTCEAGTPRENIQAITAEHNSEDTSNNSLDSSSVKMNGGLSAAKVNLRKNKQKIPSKAPAADDVGRTFYNSKANKASSSKIVNWRNRDVCSSDNSSKDIRDNSYKDSRDNSKDSSNRDTHKDRRDNLSRETSHSTGRDNYNRDSSWDNYSRDNTAKNRAVRDGGNNSIRENYTRDSYNDHYNNQIYRDNQRNRYGTQRLQRMDRNSEEDEQYANRYINYHEERQDSRRPVTSEKLQLVPASPTRHKIASKRTEKDDNGELTQRERLTGQLDRGVLECLVCCERVKQMDAVWSCNNCYHVLHLRCIRKWAASSLVEGKWRCPACQNLSKTIPTEYMCFCGAMRAPEWVRGSSAAHSCGERCQRPRACVHPCVLPCHPGPCPPCQATLNKKCGCGAETRSVVCSTKLEQTCGRKCGRLLACTVHYCTLDCHEGDCPQCTETVQQVCYCPAAESRVVGCTAESHSADGWRCGEACGRVLACGAHVCRDTCHPPHCQPCQLRPEAVLTCPCGKMKLSEKHKRTACTDPIPLCGNICAKPLACGPPNDLHFCKLECHDGACPPCRDQTVMNCRCAHSIREVDCVELPHMINNIFCTKKCNKKLSCGRHRCRELCCTLDTHRCPQPCGRTLTCGLHRCTDLCHTGHCAGCSRLGFTELRCECGTSVSLPPVPCGARPPVCEEPCPRARSCGHIPHHACHSGECPPCVVLTTKPCHGGHEERKTIPCHQEEFSCGLPCGKPLPCGKHTCIKVCHKGECATTKCVQQCMEKRPGCGHPCGAPCHVGAGDNTPCPSTIPCRLTVIATCPCKRRTQEKTCSDNAREFAKAMSSMVASKMQDGSAVDLTYVTRPGSNLKTLECDDECRVEARTRQMALVLQIRNPDVSSKLAPRYSEFLRQWAARDPSLATHVHDKLSQLVQLAKKSKQKTRSHSFPSMNRQKRQFLHEMCEYFGCESVAYDAEPNRNVVATADREKSWLPSMSILEVLEREAGKRRVPGPMLRGAAGGVALSNINSSQAATGREQANKSTSGWATLTSARSGVNPWGRPSAPSTAATGSVASAAPGRAPPLIDYFDNPPNN